MRSQDFLSSVIKGLSGAPCSLRILILEETNCPESPTILKLPYLESLYPGSDSPSRAEMTAQRSLTQILDLQTL